MKKLVLPLVAVISLIASLVWQLVYADKVNYYILSIAILVLSMIPFFTAFEHKKATARELTLVATMIAIAVVSRAAFYLIPQVKPIAAVVIVSAVCLGAEKGYIIGAFSAFVSNFIFGQGLWTPFQMVALGLVGLLAGLIFKVVKVNRWSLAGVGFILAFAVYGLIVDMSTIISFYGNNITLQGVLSIYGSGALFSAVFGGATAVFLFLFGMPFITKVNRITTKYNLK